MRWEEIIGDNFSDMVNAVQGVCLLPTSCLERHGHHLPLGTDMLIGRDLVQRAVEIEPAIIFPEFIFTQILEARHCPGTLAIEPELILRLLDNLCKEIARNGLTKIIIVNTHGGNFHLLHFFAQSQLLSRRNYTVYVVDPELLPQDQGILDSQWESAFDHHAGEHETSQMLAIRADLVDMGKVPDEQEGQPMGRLDDLKEMGGYTGIWWYADHPTHYGGMALSATAAKGEALMQANARALAGFIKMVKSDQESKRLMDEFYEKSSKPS
jgi:creatinine amidohydrolase